MIFHLLLQKLMNTSHIQHKERWHDSTPLSRMITEPIDIVLETFFEGCNRGDWSQMNSY